MRRLLPAVAILAALSAPGRSVEAAPPAADTRPNLLVLMTDDQSHDTLTDQFMPRTKRAIADQGMTFTQGHVTTALCCPSRASFLTGRYAHSTGVWRNKDRLDETTVIRRLHDAGYRTGLVGKYLNSWGGEPLPEYDSWAAWVSGWTDATMNLDGSYRTVPGYQTYVLRDLALDFLRKVPAGKPFCLLVTPHAPHIPAPPAPGDETLWSDLPPWRPPSFNPSKEPGAPDWLARQPLLSHARIRSEVDDVRQRQLACLHSVDEAFGDILDLLRSQGKLDNTFVVFYSDNGYFWGEHRLVNKDRAFEEASRVPFAIRYPPLVPRPTVDPRLVANIDLAPTFCDLALIPVPAGTDGRSLVPLLTGEGPWRDGLVLEARPALGYPGYRALRTDRYLFVDNEGDAPELYDLESDPYEMRNLAALPGHASVVESLRQRLASGRD